MSCPVGLYFKNYIWHTKKFWNLYVFICKVCSYFLHFGTCRTHISWIYNIAIGWSLQSKEQETLLFLYTGLKRKTKTFHLRIQRPLKTVCSKFNMRCWLFFLAIFLLLFFVIVGTDFVSYEDEDNGEAEDAKNEDWEEDHVTFLPTSRQCCILGRHVGQVLNNSSTKMIMKFLFSFLLL